MQESPSRKLDWLDDNKSFLFHGLETVFFVQLDYKTKKKNLKGPT